jgi:predicted metal-dependent HD superfamily phosphohydrolase
MTMKERWLRFWSAAGASGSPEPVWDDLSARYTEPARAYHTFRHIEHCLVEFEEVRREAVDPIALELALWYHDAVYDPHARDNEERSAVLAESIAAAAGLTRSTIQRAGDLIRVSTHRRAPTDPDARLFVDIDLSILGQPHARFLEYEGEVRKEYEWVPEADFRFLRALILEAFLERFTIYTTSHFVDKYEKQARENVTASVLVLRGGTPEA